MNRRTALVAAMAAIGLLIAACSGTTIPDENVPTDGEPSTEAPADPDPSWENFPTDEAREQARGLLGMNEGDLPDDVRVARRGDEEFMLTQDYVLGRRTVELDDDGSGFRVMMVTVELPDGPETFELQGG